MNRIVVGHDFSEHGDAAVRWAAALAVRTGAELVVASTFETEEAELRPGHDRELREHEKQVLADRIRSFIPREVPWRLRLLNGGAGAGLLKTQADEHADLLVVGAGERGRHTEVRLGGVLDRVAHRAELPFASVPDHEMTPELRRIVVGVDDSSSAVHAWRWSVDVGSSLGAEVSAYRLEDDDETPADGLLDEGDHRDAAIVVVGAKSKGSATDLRLGSTATRVLHRTERPVVVVPEEAPPDTL